MAYTYEDSGPEIVERFDIPPEVPIAVVLHRNTIYAPTSLAWRTDVCGVQGGCLEPLPVPPDLMGRLTLSPIFDGAFLVSGEQALFDGDGGEPPRVAFAVRHPECYGPTCPFDHEAAVNYDTPWWPEVRFMEFCAVSGGAASTFDVLQTIPDEPLSLRLRITGSFGLRPARDLSAACIRHERDIDHVSVDTILHFTINELHPNCDWYRELCQ